MQVTTQGNISENIWGGEHVLGFRTPFTMKYTEKDVNPTKRIPYLDLFQ